MKELCWQIVRLLLYGADLVMRYVVRWMKIVLRTTITVFAALLITPVIWLLNAKRKKVNENADNV